MHLFIYLTDHSSSPFCHLTLPILCPGFCCLTFTCGSLYIFFIYRERPSLYSLYILEKNLFLVIYSVVVFCCRNIFHFNIVKGIFLYCLCSFCLTEDILPYSNVIFSSKCFIFLFCTFTSLVYLELLWGYDIRE